MMSSVGDEMVLWKIYLFLDTVLDYDLFDLPNDLLTLPVSFHKVYITFPGCS